MTNLKLVITKTQAYIYTNLHSDSCMRGLVFLWLAISLSSSYSNPSCGLWRSLSALLHPFVRTDVCMAQAPAPHASNSIWESIVSVISSRCLPSSLSLLTWAHSSEGARTWRNPKDNRRMPGPLFRALIRISSLNQRIFFYSVQRFLHSSVFATIQKSHLWNVSHILLNNNGLHVQIYVLYSFLWL